MALLILKKQKSTFEGQRVDISDYVVGLDVTVSPPLVPQAKYEYFSSHSVTGVLSKFYVGFHRYHIQNGTFVNA